MRKMHARQRSGAQVVAAVGPLVRLAVPSRVRGDVLLLLLMVVVVVGGVLVGVLVLGEHLLEELELGGRQGEESEREKKEGEKGGHLFKEVVGLSFTRRILE